MSNLQQRPLVRNPYKPYQFNHLITFCDSQNTINQAGINVTKLVPAFSLHFAYIKQTITQKYQLIGTDLENTKLIAIRHNAKVNNYQYALIDNQEYRIIDVSSDNTMYIAYDILTIKQSKGRKKNG